jgi:hypothetical protein
MYSLLELLIIDALTIATFLIIKDLHDVMESHYLKAKAQPLTANLGYLM